MNEKQNAGDHKVTFNAENLSSGIYIYRMKAVREIETGMHTYFVIDNNKIKNIVVTNDFKIKQLHVDSRDELNYIINENKQGKA